MKKDYSTYFLSGGSFINTQLPAKEKAARADVVIDTSGTIAETRAKLPELWQEELRKGGAQP